MSQNNTQQNNFGLNIAYKKIKDTTNYVANVNLKDNEFNGGTYQSLDVALDFTWLDSEISAQKAKGYKKFYVSCSKIKDIEIKKVAEGETSTEETKTVKIDDLPF